MREFRLRVTEKPEKNDWCLSSCFSPRSYLAKKIELAEIEGISVDEMLARIAKNTVNFSRGVCDFFDDCRTVPKDAVYISPIARA